MPHEQGETQFTITVTSTHLLEGLKDSHNQLVWHDFVARYSPLIQRFARRKFRLRPDEAEEAAQASLIAFAESYRKGNYNRDKGRLRSWLFGIATKQIKSLLRRQQRDRFVQPDDDSNRTRFINQIPDSDVDLQAAWEEEWQKAALKQCMQEIRAQFDDRTVKAFELFAKRGEPAREVADKLGMTENAVFLAKHRILKRIRALVAALEDEW